MKVHIKVLSLLGCLFLFAAVGESKEVRVKMSDLPPAVQNTVKAEQSKGATVRGFAKDTENGKIEYEAELTVNGHGKDISMDSSGKILEVEEQVTLRSIPEAARSAIQNGAGGGRITKVEAVSRGSGPVEAYEAQVIKAGKHSEVRVAPDGSPKPEED
jgi:uncharacterized membrane protein YkoI